MNFKGLSSEEVAKKISTYGYNEFTVKRDFTALKILISNCTSFLIIILVITGFISLWLGEIHDSIAIFVIVIINTIIGFVQEYKAENAVKALKKLIVTKAIVIRDEKQIEIPIRELVPGDIILINEGDKIPADLKLIQNFSIKADESVLTGESVPVNKKVGEGKEGMLLSGTLVVVGRGVGEVIATGLNTEFGKIVSLVQKQGKTQSPLTKKLDDLGKKLALITLSIIALLFTIGHFQGIPPLNMLMTAVALGVSAIPEGMPIIVTLTLAIGVQILATKKAIVRKMSSIETLGATTVICSDKTGTLTLNEMTVSKIFTNNNEKVISGSGYSTSEKFVANKEESKLIEIANNCNNAFIENSLMGDPTEIALKILAEKSDQTKIYEKLDENVFSSERKMMSSLHEINGDKEIFAKGAFEIIVERSKYIEINGEVKEFTATLKEQFIEKGNSYANEALRVLGFAYKKFTGEFTEDDLIFIGLAGMIDPPRETVKSSIEIAHRAGIKIKIITGDNAITAQAIGAKIGLNKLKIATGEDIDKLSDEELKKLIYETDIFARTKPEHKYRIVDILKKNGEVVAVTGDGVNDAPAIKHADVGIAMGIKGTEASKEVADIVLKDDNFSTIVETIKEGRRIYKNILSFIKYMLSANFGALVTVGILTILGYPLPILPLQILWINLATDSLPALALGTSKASEKIMEEKPHPKNENLFKKFASFIFVAVIFQTIISIILYFYGLKTKDLETARTLVFTGIVTFELIFALVCKDEKMESFKKLFSNGRLIIGILISFILQFVVLYTPFMQKVFKTTSVNLADWLIILTLSLSVFLVPIITEQLRNKFKLKY